ncbi:MAG TPA: hypothetical protein VHP14_12705 [Anaerolineales bacterium]|nr:hypothetical protein [Anaerolineales bacterium]
MRVTVGTGVIGEYLFGFGVAVRTESGEKAGTVRVGAAAGSAASD